MANITKYNNSSISLKLPTDLSDIEAYKNYFWEYDNGSFFGIWPPVGCEPAGSVSAA